MVAAIRAVNASSITVSRREIKTIFWGVGTWTATGGTGKPFVSSELIDVLEFSTAKILASIEILAGPFLLFLGRSHCRLTGVNPENRTAKGGHLVMSGKSARVVA